MLSNEPASVSSSRSDFIVNTLTGSFNLDTSESFLTFLTRKSAHIFAYFILGVLAYNAFKSKSTSHKQAIIISIIFCLIYAALDETHQLFISGRSGEVRDVALDTTAACLGVFMHYHFNKIYQTRKKIQNQL